MSERRTQPLSGAERLLEPGFAGRLWLAWKLLRDPRVSGVKYLLPGLIALYVGSPIDPIPDFLLGIGQTDDMGAVILVILATAWLLPRIAPKDVVAEYASDYGAAGGSRSTSKRVVDAQYTVRS